jgi:hypothetical protein
MVEMRPADISGTLIAGHSRRQGDARCIDGAPDQAGSMAATAKLLRSGRQSRGPGMRERMTNERRPRIVIGTEDE